ncbi:metal-dependent hydrolase [Anatilimnocola floriformis]|uniref:metal-dependent hydrolase n=1 Tax=Anatilimnocola floriformis TaxID=2948575 RepID=UPI0020C2FBF1|nr:metal-dependent hydrolase [Anatilimnocola floriformis]
MTTPEHTLVGIHLALAAGCHRYWGWPAVAMAGIASNVPDWDGLPMLIDMQRFEAGHRVWGHNLLAILFAALVLGWSQAQFRWIERIGDRVRRYFSPASEAQASRPLLSTLLVFTLIAFVAQLVHLPCDMVVSGGEGLTDWLVRPFWPFSKAGYVFPLIPWGDVGPTVILMAGAIVLAKRPANTSLIALLTLFVLVAYLVVRGYWR